MSRGDRVRGKLVVPLIQAWTFLQGNTARKVLMRVSCMELSCDAGIHPSGTMTDPSTCFILAINKKSTFFK